MFKSSLPLIRKAALSASLLASGGTGSVLTFLLTKDSETTYTKLDKQLVRIRADGNKINRMNKVRLQYMGELETQQKCFETEVQKTKTARENDYFSTEEPDLEKCSKPTTELE